MNQRLASDELVYRGWLVEVRRVGLRMPDGNVVPRDLVHHREAAVVLPVLADGRIVLIRNYRFAVDETLWELPAGTLDEGEDPAACAARELAEETGYTAGSLRKLGAFCSAPGTSDEVLHAFLATDLRDGRQDLEQYEEIAVHLLDDAEVRRMVLDGTIHDAKTIASLALYWLAKEAR